MKQKIQPTQRGDMSFVSVDLVSV